MASKEQATQVLVAVRRQVGGTRASSYSPRQGKEDLFKEAFGDGPKLVENWNWRGELTDVSNGSTWSIVWEEGPFEWAYLFPHGGVEEEFGFRRQDVSSLIPDGVFAEPITSWSIGVHDDL
jgi:hypothetical protein